MKPEKAFEPRRTRRHTVIVLIAVVDRRIVPALRFVSRLPQADVRALHVSVDTEETRQLAIDWMHLGLSWLPLHIREAAADGLLASVRRIVEEEADVSKNVTVVLPELDLPQWWHPLLHRRSARRIAHDLQALPGVTTVIVPCCGSPCRRRRRSYRLA